MSIGSWWYFMPWTIYCHTHVESNRRYIGLTKKTMMFRWNQHVSNAQNKHGKGCAYFWNSIRKYGKDAFSHEVLEICDTLEEGNIAEQKWIKFYDSRNPEKGFNLMKGGEHIPHPIRKNPWNNPEYRNDLIMKLQILHEDPGYKNKLIIASQKINNDPNFITKIHNLNLRRISSQRSKNLWKDSEFRKKSIKNPVQLQNISETENVTLTQIQPQKYQILNTESSKSYQASYYEINKRRIQARNKARRPEINANVARHKEELRGIVNEVKNSPCHICDRYFGPDNMEFYSTNLKDHSIEWFINRSCSKTKILAEIHKRQLICVNCYKRQLPITG